MIENNSSIIEIIQKMVQEGQSNEDIVKTLQGLGVEKEQAKRLLLIAEADTFTLLKKEINALVASELEDKRKEFESLIEQDIKKIEEKEKIEIKKMAENELNEVVIDIKEDIKKYQSKIDENIESSQKTVNLVKISLDTLNQKSSQLELDVEQLKVHKFRKSSKIISYLFLSLGLIILVFALYLMFLNFDKIDMSQIILISIALLGSISLMFASVLT
ncbi:MAG: hypothetical protein PHQ98_02455 [Candidatus ainarchaeum sp.]|nr:hypothetical protein [Candidatus ainarchaeum sp.]